MKAEVNIKLNDDYSITLDNVRYIPDFWSEAKVSAKPEKRHTGIEEPAEDQTMCCGHGGAFLRKITPQHYISEGVAGKAIEAVGKDDVLWLYRDYQPYLNAFKMEV